jgi:phage terminase large subunit
MTFVRTTAINRISRMTARKKIIQGGTSASKTFAILSLLIDTALKNPNKEISVVAESIPHLRRGAIKDFKSIMTKTQRFREDEFNKSLLRYDFSNGSYIEFFSANEEAKLRGARRNILFINEASSITFETYYQLAIRTDEDIYLDFNPSNEFWVHTEVEQDQDSELIILTYKDNEALSETIINEIESARIKGLTSSYWANWFKVYGEGKIGQIIGVVFDNWKQVSSIPKDAFCLGYGLDFGYTSDETAIVELWSWNDKLIVNEKLYRKGMTNKEIAQFLKGNAIKGLTIVGDSSEPKSIDEIFNHGLNVVGAKKGKDSILHSIQLLQNYEMLITETSTNLIKELRGYLWSSDRNGKQENKPSQYCSDHLIDSLRYIATEKLTETRITEDTYSIY